MIIEFDDVKREKTLLERGLDFADSDKVFAGLHVIARDDRVDYGEERFLSFGFLYNRMVVILDCAKRGSSHYFHEVRK